jgi:hypothetical protein
MADPATFSIASPPPHPAPHFHIHHSFADDGFSEYASVAVSKQDFSARKKKISTFYG